MSDLADLIEKHGGSKEFADAVGSAEKIVGLASGVYGYYKTAKDLIQLLPNERLNREIGGHAVHERQHTSVSAHSP